MATKPITTGTRLTIEEFLDLPDTELREKMELDDGELYIMPRPRPVHQFLLMRLYMFIATYIDGFAEPPAQVHTDMVTILSPSSRRVLVPDLAVMLADRPYRMVRGYFEGNAGYRGGSPVQRPPPGPGSQAPALRRGRRPRILDCRSSQRYRNPAGTARRANTPNAPC